jgi:hypothetical protein
MVLNFTTLTGGPRTAQFPWEIGVAAVPPGPTALTHERDISPGNP